ncbi:GrpE protein homolog, mitochondrial, putative [Plasmodium ovale]|uniref:GrpE protein homolog n=2 Tax=Plasmodium ovale TaxID=36330 RepID=A0A1D3TI16_PLAOA|nr:GrpE protein homolog, mitochondrial, putative [Plasmodium ovale]
MFLGGVPAFSFRKNYLILFKNEKYENAMKCRLFSTTSTVSDKSCNDNDVDEKVQKGKAKTGSYNASDESSCDSGRTSQGNGQSSMNESENMFREEEINYESYNKIELINEIKKAKKDMEEKVVDNKILKEKYLSVLAEKENLRTRYMKEIENSKLYCISNFAKSLLDVADNLALAIKNISDESLKQNEEINNIYKGIEMTETILHNIFNKYGIDKYNPINEKFNPLFHEAIFEINDNTKEKGTVATVIQQGYKIKDRILRAAKVGVVKN